jgi:DnaJ family protein C protein 11
MELENLLRSKTDITTNVNATRLFAHEQELSPFSGTAYATRNSGGFLQALKKIEILQVNIKSSFEVRKELSIANSSLCCRYRPA